jgi:hypothetical protein
MALDLVRGWFADTDIGPGGKRLWQPNLQVNGAILPLPVWLDSREECEDFIRRELVGQGWIDGPRRNECPDCGATADEFCINLATGGPRIAFHSERKRFTHGGWPDAEV